MASFFDKIRKGNGALSRRKRSTRQEFDAPIHITATAKRKLLAAYADVTVADDEYAVTTVTIAESSIFVDCEQLEERYQDRSRFNVVAHGDGVHLQLRRLNKKHGGKVRSSTTHIHQFGWHPWLSGEDIGGYRAILANSKASKPYADGSRIPVILVTDTGDQHVLVGFVVTLTAVFSVDILVVPDNAPLVSRAWARAPVAIPDLPRADLLETAQRQLGLGWTARLARSKKSRSMVLLLKHSSGKAYVLALGPNYPHGRPRLLRGKEDVDDGIWGRAFDHASMIKELLTSMGDTAFSVHFEPFRVARVLDREGRDLANEIVYLDHIDWLAFGDCLLALDTEAAGANDGGQTESSEQHNSRVPAVGESEVPQDGPVSSDSAELGGSPNSRVPAVGESEVPQDGPVSSDSAELGGSPHGAETALAPEPEVEVGL